MGVLCTALLPRSGRADREKSGSAAAHIRALDAPGMWADAGAETMPQAEIHRIHRPIRAARTLVASVGRVALAGASEVAMMASVAAKTPLRVVNGGLDPARGPLPPTPSQSAQPTCPVLLVHGFCGTESAWVLVARKLSARGLTVDAITYPPFGISVEQLADRLVAEVHRLLSQTGAGKVHLVGHSLGGVVIAQAVTDRRLEGLVDTVVTLGSPFRGSPWANLLPIGGIPRALRGGSPLLRQLADAPAPDGVRWLAFTAALDVVVPGRRSVPIHARVESITVDGVGHLGMLRDRRVVNQIVDALPASGRSDDTLYLLEPALVDAM